MNTQFENIHEMKNEAVRMASYREDYSAPMTMFYGVTEEGEEIDNFAIQGLPRLTPGATPRPMSRHAYMQLMKLMKANKLGYGLYDTVKPYFPGEMARVTNLLLRKNDFTHTHNGQKERQLFVRSRREMQYLNGEMSAAEIRATLTDSYVPIDTADVLTVASNFAAMFERGSGMDELMRTASEKYGEHTKVEIDKYGPNGNGIGHSLSKQHLDIDGCSATMKLGVRITTPEGDIFNPTAWFRTNDNGGGSVQIQGGVFREICKNGWVSFVPFKDARAMDKAQGWAPIIPHRWGTREDLKLKAEKATFAALLAGSEIIAKSREAARRALPNANQILAEVIGGLVPKDQRDDTLMIAAQGMVDEFSPEGSVLSVVNGITYAAHKSDAISHDTRDEMEIAGGAVMQNFNREMSDRDITMLFRGAASVRKLADDNILD